MKVSGPGDGGEKEVVVVVVVENGGTNVVGRVAVGKCLASGVVVAAAVDSGVGLLLLRPPRVGWAQIGGGAMVKIGANCSPYPRKEVSF